MSFLAKYFWWVPFGTVPEIGAEELARRLESPAPPLILDVRSPAEFREGHIPGARNVSLGQLRRRLDEGALAADLSGDRPVVAICFSAHRSIPAVRLLTLRGQTDVVQLAGGMRVWTGPTAALRPREC